MKLEVVNNPRKELLADIEKKIEAFNLAHWEVKERSPLAVVITDEQANLIAGATGKTFGYWLLIENIWVSEALRGKNMGSQLLTELEKAAIARGCKFALLDTLNFQAKPFYEKFGYTVQWVQESYPKDGCKYYMVKKLA
jgi:GNAT superfamily N-acetyltransferase